MTSDSKRRVQLEKLEVRNLLAAVSGEVFFDANADGIRQSGENVAADVRVYVDQNQNGRFDLSNEPSTITDADGIYSFPQLPAGDYDLRIDPAPGLVQTAPAVTYGWNDTVVQDAEGQFFRAAQLFQIDLNGNVTNLGQPTSNRMDGLVRTSDGTLISVDSRSNEVFRINPFNGERTRVSQSNLDIVGGIAYDRVTNSVYTLVRGGSDASSRVLARIDINTARTELIGGGLSGLSKVSDLTFDSVNREVIGFDDADDKFFAFDLFGRGRIISFANRVIDSEAMTIADPSLIPAAALASSPAGSTFVRMFDADDNERTATFIVNVTTGEVFDGSDSSVSLKPTALERSALGNNARSISLEAVEIRNGVNFGLTDDVIGFRLAPLTPESGPGSLSQAGVTVVGGAIGEDFVEITLNRQPDSNVVLNVNLTANLGGLLGAELNVNTLTFTPEDWNTPRRITITPDVDSPVSLTTALTLSVSVDALNSDVLWRTLPIQQLPVRVLPPTQTLAFDAPLINEVFVNSRFTGDFNDQTDQYIELRGTPGQVLPAGTYFVVIEEFITRTGQVHAVFDLSNRVFGSNGFMVLLQANSTYEVSLGATQLRSDSNGFTGIPGGIFTGGDAAGSIDTVFDNSSFFLIQSDTAPVVGDDVDADNNGVIDPTSSAAAWTVYDAVAMHSVGSYSDNSLAPIVFIESSEPPRVQRSAREQNLIFTRGYGYVGRIGDSIGSEYNDWVYGTMQLVDGSFLDLESDPAGLFEFEDENVSFPALLDRPLDHVGSSNFIGGVRGRLTVLPSAGDIRAGTSADTRLPAEGVTVFVDTNDNGIRDELIFGVDPEAVVPPFDFLNPQPFNAEFTLTNAFPGVVITSSTSTGSFIEDDIVSSRQTISGRSVGNRIFSRGSIDWFTESSRLRFDFHNPIRSASIDVLNRNSFQFVYGRLDAFNAAGELVASSVSAPVFGSRRGTVTVTAPGEEIVRIEAYADTGFSQSSPFGSFDSFSYSQLEPSATTDQNGIYEISGLFPGSYSLNILDTVETANLLSTNLQPFFISRYENFFFESQFQPNTVPVLLSGTDLTFDTFENPAAGTIVGNVDGFDADLTPLTYEFVGGDSTGLVLQPLADGTADIVATEGVQLDFETESERVLTVRVSDSLSSITARVRLAIVNVNEGPVVSDQELAVTEDLIVSDTFQPVIGAIDAFDPDNGSSDGLTYEIVGGDGQAFFTIDETTGVIRLIQTPDFETVSILNLGIRVTDSTGGSVVVNKIVRVGDENDTPSIAVSSFNLDENQTGDLFRLQVVDADAGQLHAFALASPPQANPPHPTPSDAFGIRSDGTVFLRPGFTLDFDVAAPNTFWIVVSDNGSPSKASTHQITVDLNNVDEPARIELPGEGGDPFELREDATNFVGQVFLTLRDPEGLDNDYAFDLLPGPSSDLFAFDPLTGVLKVAENKSLDFETATTHDLTFEIFDRTGQIEASRQTITIDVLNVNEPATILTSEIIVSETPAAGDVIGRIRTFDPEGDSLTIAVVGGSAAEFFEFGNPIDPFALNVKGTVDFDVESTVPRELNIIVEVRDAASDVVMDTRTVAIRLNEVNEPPIFNSTVVASLANTAVVSGLEFRIQLPENLAVDPDPVLDPGLTRPDLQFRVGQQVFDANGNAVLNESGRTRLQLPNWMTFDATTRTLIGSFASGFGSVPELTIRALEFGAVPLSTDATLTLPTIEPTNPVNRFDVNGDGFVTPVDALRVINYLNGNVPEATTLQGLYDHIRFLDVSGAVDGVNQVTALDAIQIINELNRIAGSTAVGPNSEPTDLTTAANAESSSNDEERRRREDAVDVALGESILF